MPAMLRATLLAFLALPLVARGGEDKPMTARHVHYSGKVQGVGFRATAAEIAPTTA